MGEARKTAKAKRPASTRARPVQSKDSAMTATTDFTEQFQTAAGDIQDRAKAAFEKGSAMLADAGEFSKGNVEAMVEAGKIFAAGLQELGKDCVTDGKGAFETMTADVKELAAAKTPTDFFKLQGDLLRRNFDALVAASSKRSEALLKLSNDSFAPLSTRVSLAVDKFKQAA
jgi:phasin family protein